MLMEIKKKNKVELKRVRAFSYLNKLEIAE